jgi:hypothetical protein
VLILQQVCSVINDDHVIRVPACFASQHVEAVLFSSQCRRLTLARCYHTVLGIGARTCSHQEKSICRAIIFRELRIVSRASGASGQPSDGIQKTRIHKKKIEKGDRGKRGKRQKQRR